MIHIPRSKEEMEGLRAPDELQLTGNAHQAWQVFKQRFEIYEEATAVKDRADKKKIALLLNVAGQAAIDLYNTFTFDEQTPRTYTNVMAKFEAYCTPKKNESYERWVFRNLTKAPSDSIDEFIVLLRKKVKTCNFGEIEESMIRDQIIAGVSSPMRAKLLAEEELTLERAVTLCRAAERLAAQVKAWSEQTNESATPAGASEKLVDAIEQNKNRHFRAKGDLSRKKKTNQDGKAKLAKDNIISECHRCLGTHKRNNCPAYNKICAKCKGRNHFAKACRTRRDVHTVEADTEEEFLIDVINLKEGEEDWFIPIKFGSHVVQFKVDTGAQANLIPLDVYELLFPKPKRHGQITRLTAYGGHQVNSYGRIELNVKVKFKQLRTKMILVKEGETPILSLKTCEALGIVSRVYPAVEAECNDVEDNCEESPVVNTLITDSTKFRQEVLEAYPSVFKGIGCLEHTCNIKLKEEAVPVIIPPRRIPYALRNKLNTELNRLEKQGIIRKVDEPTDWVSPLVIIEKKNGLRLCLDPQTLNRNIRREHYQIPTKEEVQAELAGAVYFSKLDAASGFYQIPLDGQSQVLTTFNTPFGRYCFRRLPFGIASAPEIFFKAFNQIFDSAEGMRPLHDDVLIWGRSIEEHDARLHEALTRLRKANATLNPEKCVFRTTSITYMGEVISSEGIRPDPHKIEAIVNMPKPKSRADVQRALGIVNFLGKYIPKLSANTVHLRSYLKKETDPQWGPEHDQEWEYIKGVLIRQPVLQFFDPERITKISTDASNDGLGAVLMQKYDDGWKPIAYASRSLTEAETRYAQIEKESLGLVFGCQRFHNYVYGREIVLETDHKPLLAMTKRVLAEVPPRLQRLFLKLMRYQFKLIFTPGKELIIADALSRASLPMKHCEKELYEETQVHVSAVVQSLPISPEMLTRLKEETKNDPVLNKVIEQLHNGWNKSDNTTAAYATVQSELSEVDGLILKGSRIVVPTSLRKRILDVIHDGHLGIEKCRRRARQAVYWPNINTDIDQKCKSCPTCNKFQYTQQHEPLMMRETPRCPWERVATDIFHCNGKNYIVIIDAYSNYIEVEGMKQITANEVIKKLKSIFARHGIPLELLSDNVPFDSDEFRQFAKDYGFTNTCSSPKYPRSNGLAEKGVQIAKRLLKKALDANEDFELGLLSYRSTPLDCGKSPFELLMGRKARTRLPAVEPQPSQRPPTKRKQTMKGKELGDLDPGDVVRIQDLGRWENKATVLKKVAPRSYVVEATNGAILRRNRHQLLKVKEALDISTEEVPSIPVEASEQNIVHAPEAAQIGPSTLPRRSKRITRKPNRLGYSS